MREPKEVLLSLAAAVCADGYLREEPIRKALEQVGVIIRPYQEQDEYDALSWIAVQLRSMGVKDVDGKKLVIYDDDDDDGEEMKS